MNEWELLEKIAKEYRVILGDKLTGIYVHGSIAFGCFRWACSDIDFLVIVEEPLGQLEKEALIQTLLQLDEHAPQKGFEMSVMLRSACMPFADPTPYELHYSNAYREKYHQDLSGTCRRLQGFDPDLAGHVMVVWHKGIVLCGEAIAQVFAPVPPESWLRSIWQDVRCAEEEIGQDPVYHALNLCRTLAFVQDGLVLSKREGGEWGMTHLAEYADVIVPVLNAYAVGAAVPDGRTLDEFAKNVLERIRNSQVFLNAGMESN